MKQTQLNEIVAYNNQFIAINGKDDIQAMIEVVEDIMEAEIKDMEAEEPYAINSINNLKIGKEALRNLYYTIDDMEE